MKSGERASERNPGKKMKKVTRIPYSPLSLSLSKSKVGGLETQGRVEGGWARDCSCRRCRRAERIYMYTRIHTCIHVEGRRVDVAVSMGTARNALSWPALCRPRAHPFGRTRVGRGWLIRDLDECKFWLRRIMIQGTWFRALARGERGARVRVKGGCKEQFCSLGWLTARDYDIVVEVGTYSPSLGGSRRLINAPVVLELWEFCT